MKKRRKRGLQRAKPHPKFGATKAQGLRNKRERDLANKIHELETLLAAREREVQKLDLQLNTLSTFPFSAVERLMNVSVQVAVGAGILESVGRVSRWYHETYLPVASGKVGDER